MRTFLLTLILCVSGVQGAWDPTSASVEGEQPCPGYYQTFPYSKILISSAVTYNGSNITYACSPQCVINTPVPICGGQPNPGLVFQWKADAKKVILTFGDREMTGLPANNNDNCWEYCFGKEDFVADQLIDILSNQNFDGININYQSNGFLDVREQTFINLLIQKLSTRLPAGAVTQDLMCAVLVAPPTFPGVPGCLPTLQPTLQPTHAPTQGPVTFTAAPTTSIPQPPTTVPSAAPTTDQPASATSVPSVAPTLEPSAAPTTVPTSEPTSAPTTKQPAYPTSEPTAAPTSKPSSAPTTEQPAPPTSEPSAAPTLEPSSAPTTNQPAPPTSEPSAAPTAEPSSAPTSEPSSAPTSEPSSAPTTDQPAPPTSEPSAAPTLEPSSAPTSEPTSAPTTKQPAYPTSEPTAAPTSKPSSAPTTDQPTPPTSEPSAAPTLEPSSAPTTIPIPPTSEPSAAPTTNQPAFPTSEPSAATLKPSSAPTTIPVPPTSEPSAAPMTEQPASPVPVPPPTSVPKPPTSEPSSAPTTNQPASPTPEPLPTTIPEPLPTTIPEPPTTEQPEWASTSEPTMQPEGSESGSGEGEQTPQPLPTFIVVPIPIPTPIPLPTFIVVPIPIPTPIPLPTFIVVPIPIPTDGEQEINPCGETIPELGGCTAAPHCCENGLKCFEKEDQLAQCMRDCTDGMCKDLGDVEQSQPQSLNGKALICSTCENWQKRNSYCAAADGRCTPIPQSGICEVGRMKCFQNEEIASSARKMVILVLKNSMRDFDRTEFTNNILKFAPNMSLKYLCPGNVCPNGSCSDPFRKSSKCLTKFDDANTTGASIFNNNDRASGSVVAIEVDLSGQLISAFNKKLLPNVVAIREDWHTNTTASDNVRNSSFEDEDDDENKSLVPILIAVIGVVVGCIIIAVFAIRNRSSQHIDISEYTTPISLAPERDSLISGLQV